MHFHELVLVLLAATQTGALSGACEEPMLLAKNNLCVCPLKCACYAWKKLRRVDCVRKRLANINANDLPVKVQVLDISDNLVAELTDGYFWGLSQIEYLYVARNALHNLEPLALSGLRRLTVLDLSDNRLRVLPPRLFTETPSLKELRLAGNNLVSVSAAQKPFPIITAQHLQELDVSRCQLAYLSDLAFVGVLKLISLNVSNNQFLQLPTQVIAPLRSLRYLYADGNPFNCDAGMAKLTSLLQQKNVTSSGLCEFHTTSGPPVAAPFERMIALPDYQSYDRESKADYSYDWDWEREELTVRSEQPGVPVSSRPELSDSEDRCVPLTKPERFFKFEYSNLFSCIIGFKIGFVCALLMLRGCNGRAPSQSLSTDHGAHASLLRRQINGQRGNATNTPAGNDAHCNNEDRPETPPPAYHELQFNQ